MKTLIKNTLIIVLVTSLWMSGAIAASAQLRELIRLAETSSPSVLKAQRDLELAQTMLAEAQADLGWTLDVSTVRPATLSRAEDGSWTAQARLAADARRNVTDDRSLVISLDDVGVNLDESDRSLEPGSLTVGLAMRYPRGVVHPEVQLVKERARDVEQKALALELAREAAVLAVAQAYYNYWKTNLDYQVAQQQLEIYSLQLEKSKALEAVGRGTATEVRVAEQRVKVAELDIIAARSQREAAVGELARLLGVDREWMWASIESWEEPTWQPHSVVPYDKLRDEAENRPEVRQAQLNLRISEEKLELARLGTPYEVKPLVSYDLNDKNLAVGVDVVKSRESGSESGTLTASLRLQPEGQLRVEASFVTTLLGGDTSESKAASVRNAEADFQIAQTNLQQAYEDAQDKIYTSWLDVSARAARYDLQLALTEREWLNFITEQARAEVGAATPADVAEAQFAHVQAEAATQKALYEWQMAYLRLLAVVGDYEALGELEG
ncbi:MAG: TolC family protein [Firmicutes bacterium]|jgi:outer membrane protein TolC|nr:TolC family protein [Bacillota bacterium]